MNERVLSAPNSTKQSNVEAASGLDLARHTPSKLFIKYATDRLVGVIGLIILSPLMFLTAIAVRVSLGNPIIFSQPRVGLHGRIFRIYKFRTMRDIQDPQGCPLPDDQRTTPLGNLLRRAKLDELPQMFHVANGDMSLVGPRPLMPFPDDPKQVQPNIHYALQSGGGPLDALRRQMKPGITGWTQVNGNTRFSLGDRMRLDAWWIRHFSLSLDLRIIFMTLRVLLLDEQVNHAALQAAHTELPPHWRGSTLDSADGAE
ncbi:MAG: putative glycosyltransferase [Holophagaceae bacterium]|nr:putative glycosyltransferase [Holophagaceae bacterium]